MNMHQAFKYCLRCGSKVTSSQGKLSCRNCGLDFYLNPKACTGIILKNEAGEILLVKRAIDPRKGFWDVPGGFVDQGETFEECTIREAKEELGAEITDLKYIDSMIDTYLFQDIEYETLGVMFEATLNNIDDLEPADDVASYEFFKPDALPFEDFSFRWMEKFFRNYV